MTSATTPFVRVDNRLVHGQVLAAWIPHLRVETIVVVDDEAAQNTLVRSAMAIAVGDVALEVVRLDDAAKAANAGQRVLVLVRDIADAVRGRASGLRFDVLNIGNVHYTAGRRAITPSVYLSEAELAQLAAMEREGVRVEVRTVPQDTAISVDEMRRTWARAG